MSLENNTLCSCGDPEGAICLMRRESGICPQLPRIELLKAKLRWLIETNELEIDICEFDEPLPDEVKK